MKQLFSALSLAAALLITSCSKDLTEDNILNNEGNNSVATQTITVGIDNSQTRIHLGEEEDNYIPLYWSEGDIVYVNVYTDGVATASEPISANDNGAQSASIAVPDGATEIFMGIKQSLTKSGYIYIPVEQSYDNTKFANGHAILLGAINSQTGTATLKHVCGYMKVSLKGAATVNKVMLRAIGHEPMAGYHKYEIGENTTISDYEQLGIADGYYTAPIITINCGDGVTLTEKATDFYFAIPAGNYSKGFALTILDNNNKQQTVAAYKSGKEIMAGRLVNMPELTVNCTQDAGIYDINQFMGFARTIEKDCWMDNNKTVNIYSDIDVSQENSDNLKSLIYLRSDFATYNNSDITYIKGAKTDNSRVVISNFNISTSSDSGLLFYNIPSTLTVENIQLGQVADNPTTTANEADCTLTVSTNKGSSYQYVGTFCCVPAGTVKNCVNNATTDVTIKNKGVLIGAFSSGSSSSTGNIINCTNYGHIKLSDAAGTATNWVAGIAARVFGSIEGCTNEGAINVTSATATNYIGGVVARSELTTFTNLTNKGNIDVTMTNTSALIYIGGVCGDVNTKKSKFTNCDNSGNIKVFGNKSTDTNWSYIGGIVGRSASNATHTNHDQQGNMTVKFSGKCRVGGIGGYASKSTSCNVKATTINIENAGTGSNIGGYTAYSNDTTKSSCSVDVTITNSASNVYIGGLVGQANGTTWTNCTLKADISSTGSNVKSGLVTTTAVSLVSDTEPKEPYTLTLGAANKPFKISTASKIMGVSVNSQTLVDSVTEGKANLYVYEIGEDGAYLSTTMNLAKTNVQFAN